MSEVELGEHCQVQDQTTWLEIDRDALKHNVMVVRQLTLPSAALLVVVKANAYGHGLREVSNCLRDEAAYFGVSTLEEALRLRHFEIDTPILLFGVLFGSSIDQAIESEISQAVSSVEQARQISGRSQKLKKEALIHIKVDTGMGRLGIPKREALSAITQIAALPGLHLEGVFTHFSQGGEAEDPFTEKQVADFCELLRATSQRGIHFAYRHAANTVGVLHYRQAHFNLVRPGLLIYGLSPTESLRWKLRVKPVLSWKAKIILLKRLLPGESTGYARSFVTDRETTIGILPIGYSHGYPFALSNKGKVLHGGKPYPVVGRVSMDYVAVNFGLSFKGSVGDTVTILGKDGDEFISGEWLARRAGTIPYEIVTQLSPSVPRVVVSSNAISSSSL